MPVLDGLTEIGPRGLLGGRLFLVQRSDRFEHHLPARRADGLHVTLVFLGHVHHFAPNCYHPSAELTEFHVGSLTSESDTADGERGAVLPRLFRTLQLGPGSSRLAKDSDNGPTPRWLQAPAPFRAISRSRGGCFILQC